MDFSCKQVSPCQEGSLVNSSIAMGKKLFLEVRKLKNAGYVCACLNIQTTNTVVVISLPGRQKSDSEFVADLLNIRLKAEQMGLLIFM